MMKNCTNPCNVNDITSLKSHIIGVIRNTLIHNCMRYVLLKAGVDISCKTIIMEIDGDFRGRRLPPHAGAGALG